MFYLCNISDGDLDVETIAEYFLHKQLRMQTVVESVTSLVTQKWILLQ